MSLLNRTALKKYYQLIHESPLPTLISLKNLINYGMDSEVPLFLLLYGQSSIHGKLGHPQLEALRWRIRVRYTLRPLSPEETGSYINHQRKICGVAQSLFGDDAEAAVFQHLMDTLSEINALCFDLLIYAAAHSKQIIGPSMLEVVIHNRRGVSSTP